MILLLKVITSDQKVCVTGINVEILLSFVELEENLFEKRNFTFLLGFIVICSAIYMAVNTKNIHMNLIIAEKF